MVTTGELNMIAHSQILLIGRDQMLLQTRRLILGTYFEVETAGRPSEAGALLSRVDFDLIIFCDTLTDGECEQIAEMVRDREPHPMLILLLSPGCGRHTEVGRKLALPGGPLQLLRECADLLHFDLRANTKQKGSPASCAGLGPANLRFDRSLQLPAGRVYIAPARTSKIRRDALGNQRTAERFN